MMTIQDYQDITQICKHPHHYAQPEFDDQIFCFCVEGQPVPKQSYRAVKGGGYTSPRVKAWQEAVAWKAKEAMQWRNPIEGPVSVRLVFILKNKRRMDCDNLSKGTLDGMRGIVYKDDNQIVNLHIIKRIIPKAITGVFIEVHSGEKLPPFYKS